MLRDYDTIKEKRNYQAMLARNFRIQIRITDVNAAQIKQNDLFLDEVQLNYQLAQFRMLFINRS